MSLILDALKKSEAERQRGQVPHLLSPLPVSSSHTQLGKPSRWPLYTLILVIFAILCAGYFYLKSQVTPAPDPAAIVVESVSLQASKPKPIKIPKLIATTPKPIIVEKPTPVAPATVVSIAASPAEPTATTPSIVQTETLARIASLSEMSAEQRQQLPTLKLSMHVFSADAGKRFAIIDGQRINEGSVLGTAVVEQIRQDGVVLSVQGQSYLLPRP